VDYFVVFYFFFFKKMEEESTTETKSGFLTKQGEIIQSWKRRWFALNGSTLKYFKDEKRINGRSLGTIQLATYKIKKVINTEFCNKPNAFVLLPRDQQERPYLVYADTEREMIEWMQAIQNAIDGKLDSRLNYATNEELEEFSQLVLENTEKQKQEIDIYIEPSSPKLPSLKLGETSEEERGRIVPDKDKPRKEFMGNYRRTEPEIKLEEMKKDEIKLEDMKKDEIKKDEIKLEEIKKDEIRHEEGEKNQEIKMENGVKESQSVNTKVEPQTRGLPARKQLLARQRTKKTCRITMKIYQPHNKNQSIHRIHSVKNLPRTSLKQTSQFKKKK